MLARLLVGPASAGAALRVSGRARNNLAAHLRFRQVNSSYRPTWDESHPINRSRPPQVNLSHTIAQFLIENFMQVRWPKNPLSQFGISCQNNPRTASAVYNICINSLTQFPSSEAGREMQMRTARLALHFITPKTVQPLKCAPASPKPPEITELILGAAPA